MYSFYMEQMEYKVDVPDIMVIVDSDEAGRNRTLWERLEDDLGLLSVEYSPHFGNYVYFNVPRELYESDIKLFEKIRFILKQYYCKHKWIVKAGMLTDLRTCKKCNKEERI